MLLFCCCIIVILLLYYCYNVVILCRIKLTTSGVLMKSRVGLKLPLGVAAPVSMLSAPPIAAINFDLVSILTLRSCFNYKLLCCYYY